MKRDKRNNLIIRYVDIFKLSTLWICERESIDGAQNPKCEDRVYTQQDATLDRVGLLMNYRDRHLLRDWGQTPYTR